MVLSSVSVHTGCLEADREGGDCSGLGVDKSEEALSLHKEQEQTRQLQSDG